jgi:hypothetical protein
LGYKKNIKKKKKKPKKKKKKKLHTTSLPSHGSFTPRPLSPFVLCCVYFPFSPLSACRAVGPVFFAVCSQTVFRSASASLIASASLFPPLFLLSSSSPPLSSFGGWRSSAISCLPIVHLPVLLCVLRSPLSLSLLLSLSFSSPSLSLLFAVVLYENRCFLSVTYLRSLPTASVVACAQFANSQLQPTASKWLLLTQSLSLLPPLPPLHLHLRLRPQT